MKIEDVTMKDVGRLIGMLMLDGVGYNLDLLLTRMQIGLAMWMTPGFLPFF